MHRMYICKYEYMYRCKYVCISLCVHVKKYQKVFSCMDASVNVSICVYVTRFSLFLCIYVNMCVCKYEYM